eukprot:scaffold227870_cov37-Cyclotella_meneghiniana.AAC.1
MSSKTSGSRSSGGISSLADQLEDKLASEVSVDSRPLYELRDGWNGRTYCDLICGGCAKEAPSMDAYMHCSQCKAIKYCSKKCQALDWKSGGKAPFSYVTTHKKLCPVFKAAKEEYASSEICGVSLRKYFEWSDQHHPKVDSFFEFEYMVRLGLHKRSDVSFWARPSQMLGSFENHSSDASGSFQNGIMLLGQQFPTLQRGWVNLKDGEYPSEKSPSKVPDSFISCWKEYMEYRKLSPTSVAPLLLHNVLTAYQMLKDLGITTGKRLVYLLGVELELNMVPLFGELAYLMPDIDLTLVMVSPSVKKICDKAKELPNSIISKAPRERSPCNVTHATIFENNPENFGRVKIALCPDDGYFHEAFHEMFMPIICDAAIGLNAGIGAYDSWIPTLSRLVYFDIPWAFSDHTIANIQFIKLRFESIRAGPMPYFRPAGLETKLNPFHCPINRDVGIMVLPNMNNGYLLIWRGQKD